MRRFLALGTALLLGCTLTASAADKINVLIIDGQHNHKWAETTPAVKALLEKTGRFNVTVATTPGAKDPKEKWNDFKPDFSKANVVLMNYCGQEWPADAKQAFEKFVSDGGGLVVYHAALISWPKYEAWNNMTGLAWRPNSGGDRVYFDKDLKPVRVAKDEGPGGSHGPAHPFEVTVLDKQHPIMKDMPEKWMHVQDELYHGQRGPAKDLQFLAVAFSAKEKGGTGVYEPMAWTLQYGKGRVFVSLLGHAVPETIASDSATWLARGCEWVATGEVTIPVQK